MTPGDIFGTFGAQALAVLPWVAAGLAAAVGLALVLVGIRKGLGFFFGIIEGEGSGRGGMTDAARSAIDGYGAEAFALMSAGGGFGYDEAGRIRFVESYIEERLAGQSVKGAQNDAHVAVEL